MARVVESVSVVVVTAAAIAYAVFPARVSRRLGPGIESLVDGVRWASEALPRPVFIATVFVVTTMVTVLVALAYARVFYTLLRRAGPRTTRAYRFLAPSTPIGKGAVGLTIGVCLLLGMLYALPGAIGNLEDNSSVSGADDIAAGTVDSSNSLLRGDTVTFESGDAYQRPTPDRDGDRLNDTWERRGRTPAGVRLPGADPGRMDIYVQVNYGGGTIPLTDEEKRQLRRIWANMPVQNPDGSTGISLHLTDQRPRGGGVGGTVEFSGVRNAELLEYYTPRYLSNRTCVYHQVVVGDIEKNGVLGRAATPGYSAIVDDTQWSYDGEVSARVHVITHALLHNVVGGGRHTDSGWLATGLEAENTHLSERTARRLQESGFAGSGFYQTQAC